MKAKVTWELEVEISEIGDVLNDDAALTAALIDLAQVAHDAAVTSDTYPILTVKVLDRPGLDSFEVDLHRDEVRP